MTKSHLKYFLAAFVWFSVAIAIVLDCLNQMAVIEPELEEMRRHNQSHSPEEAYWICWWPRIHLAWVLPFIFAGLFTVAGRWKTGMAIGVPAGVMLAYGIWSWS
jgi:hypothetical protein